MIAIKALIKATWGVDYVFGLFRDFAKFDNHLKTPSECDSICLLAIRGSVPNVRGKFDSRQQSFYRRMIGTRRGRERAGRRLRTSTVAFICTLSRLPSINPLNSMRCGPLFSFKTRSNRAPMSSRG
jgi:hypothetical protein